jgi:hypothetical protein
MSNISDADILRTLGEVDRREDGMFSNATRASILDIDSFALDIEFMNATVSRYVTINGSDPIALNNESDPVIPEDQEDVDDHICAYYETDSRVYPVDTNQDGIWDTTYIYITTDGSRDDEVMREIDAYFEAYNDRVPSNMRIHVDIHQEIYHSRKCGDPFYPPFMTVATILLSIILLIGLYYATRKSRY